MLVLGGALLVGCVPTTGTDTDTTDPTNDEQSLQTDNGLQDINGMTSTNGLSGNGLSGNGLSGNGLSGNGLVLDGLAGTGIQSSTYLMNSAGGISTLNYLVKCALPLNHNITKLDAGGVSHTFLGQIGVAPQWETGTCNSDCQELVTACMLAHVNTTGQHYSIWIDGDGAGIGWGQSTSFPYQEGSFYGNIFLRTPKPYYCNGADFSQGETPGRLGTQTGAPYTDPLGYQVLCNSRCTWANSSHDGFSQCPGLSPDVFKHVVTVWRNFDAATNYKICLRTYGRCLDNGGSGAANATMSQKTYNSSNGQKWRIAQLSPGKYKITDVASGLALDVNGTGTANGTALVQNSYSGATDQQWSIKSMADGTGFDYLIPSNTTTQIAAVAAGNTNVEGAPVVMWANQSADYQKWAITLAK
jgi:hypothetical protein